MVVDVLRAVAVAVAVALAVAVAVGLLVAVARLRLAGAAREAVVVLVLVVERGPQREDAGGHAHGAGRRKGEAVEADDAARAGRRSRGRHVHAELREGAEALRHGPHGAAAPLVHEALRERGEAHVEAVEADAREHDGPEEGHEVAGRVAEPPRGQALAADAQRQRARGDEDRHRLHANEGRGHAPGAARALGEELEGAGAEHARGGAQRAEEREHQGVEAHLREEGREHYVVGGEDGEEEQRVGERQHRHARGVLQEGAPGPLLLGPLAAGTLVSRDAAGHPQLRAVPLRGHQEPELRQEGEGVTERHGREAHGRRRRRREDRTRQQRPQHLCQ
mmetsp:Transcript_75900/g.245782  ORF Transcript_75900/g.245782 Transcript_75900/m.245782 type:complete len:335 (+) Transcript_75900:250-1254(+)